MEIRAGLCGLTAESREVLESQEAQGRGWALGKLERLEQADLTL